MKKNTMGMVSEVREFFEREAVDYAAGGRKKEGDELKLGMLKELAKEGDSLLDVGCGNGYFIDRALAETNMNQVYGLDISKAMLKLNNEVPNKYLCQASALQLPFQPHSFTFTHFDAMLHHVVGARRKSSVEQAYKVIQNSVSVTKTNGFLVLTERCIDTRISSNLIFYALKFLSKTPLAKLTGVAKGLIVSFLTPDEFFSGIRATGASIVRIEVTHAKPSFLFRLALCRDHPRIHVLVSPNRTSK